MKACKRCASIKAPTDFYEGDSSCKECRCAIVRAHRVANPEKLAAYERQRFHGNPIRRAAAYATARRHTRLHPLKKKTRSITGQAIRSGALLREPCTVCGSAKSEAHHDDYTKPLEVRWLCRKHHMELHRKAA